MPLLSKPQLSRLSPTIRVSNPAAKRTLRESAARRLKSATGFDIFLSHRFLDEPYVLLLRNYLESLGYTVFVDWIELPEIEREKVNKRTAAYLRRVMDTSDSLLFAVSENSAASSWMPWELGYFDGSGGRVAIVPITENKTTSETYKGREYLGLYPYVTMTKNRSGRNKLWVNKSASKYVTFEEWMEGRPPT
jgi:TIR domain